MLSCNKKGGSQKTVKAGAEPAAFPAEVGGQSKMQQYKRMQQHLTHIFVMSDD